MLTSAGVVATRPGGHPEQVLGQSHKLQVLQGRRGVELTGRIVNSHGRVALGECRRSQNPQQAGSDMRISLGAEGDVRPGPELRELAVEKPGPVQVGNESTCGFHALGDGVRGGPSQVLRAGASDRGPRRRLRCLDPAIDSGREAYVVVDILPISPVAHCGCRRLLGELPHRVEEPVTSLSNQVDVPDEQRAPEQMIDRVRHVVAHNRAGGLAVEGTYEHRQCGECLPIP